MSLPRFLKINRPEGIALEYQRIIEKIEYIKETEPVDYDKIRDMIEEKTTYIYKTIYPPSPSNILIHGGLISINEGIGLYDGYNFNDYKLKDNTIGLSDSVRLSIS